MFPSRMFLVFQMTVLALVAMSCKARNESSLNESVGVETQWITEAEGLANSINSSVFTFVGMAASARADRAKEFSASMRAQLKKLWNLTDRLEGYANKKIVLDGVVYYIPEDTTNGVYGINQVRESLSLLDNDLNDLASLAGELTSEIDAERGQAIGRVTQIAQGLQKSSQTLLQQLASWRNSESDQSGDSPQVSAEREACTLAGGKWIHEYKSCWWLARERYSCDYHCQLVQAVGNVNPAGPWRTDPKTCEIAGSSADKCAKVGAALNLTATNLGSLVEIEPGRRVGCHWGVYPTQAVYMTTACSTKDSYYLFSPICACKKFSN